jgi:uncharacterized protein (DUF1499 family)
MGKNKGLSPIAIAGFSIALAASFSAVLAGLGTRLELWDFRTGLKILRWAAYGGVPATVISFVGLILSFRKGARSGIVLCVAGFVLGGLLVGVSWSWLQKTKTVPRIHDITTDTENPPEFAAVLPLREKATNPPSYGGPPIAEQQRKAYPDIVPLVLNAPPEDVYSKAILVARQLGWEIIDSAKGEGRIEAVDTTFWFGFKDDVVIRIKKSDSGSRVDIRSVSRVGVSDVGTNAERIRRFLEAMR